MQNASRSLKLGKISCGIKEGMIAENGPSCKGANVAKNSATFVLSMSYSSAAAELGLRGPFVEVEAASSSDIADSTRIYENDLIDKRNLTGSRLNLLNNENIGHREINTNLSFSACVAISCV